MNTTAPAILSNDPARSEILIPDLPQLVVEFLATIDSPNTYRAYKTDLKRFLEFTRGNLSDSSLLHYKRSLSRDKLAPRTINRNLTVVRQLLDLLVFKGRLSRNYYGYKGTGKGPKIDKLDSPYVALTDEEVRAMINVYPKGTSKRLFLILGFHLGLRVSEIASVSLQDLSGDVLTVRGKGDKVRTIGLPESIMEEIEACNISEGYIIRLLGHLGNLPVSTRTLSRWFKEAAELAGVGSDISTHSARATMITKALDSGADLRSVANLAGHTNLDTTMIYDKKRGQATKKTVSLIKY